MMKSYKNLNNIGGWLAFLVAFVVYTLTVEETASFWDCGEFIACAEKLQVPHPPGAPLFMILGRVFAMFAAEPTQIAFWINMLSVASSAFTILFLHWTITMIARKIVQKGIHDDEPSMVETLAIQASGLVGALAYTFSDSFWFSAGEAEVYALSSIFTALVIWTMLRWEREADKPDADRWILATAFVIGLSTGVHLLNLLTLPALGLMYYFRKYEVNMKGLIATLGISLVILFFVLIVVIQKIPGLAWSFEYFFVNNLGFGFNTGIYVFLLSLIAVVAGAVYWSIKNGNNLVNLIALSVVFILIGYTPYGLIIIRSNQNPVIDENNPEAIPQFVSYLKREQYGSSPILSGYQFTAYGGRPTKVEQGVAKYKKGDNGKYVIYKHTQDVEYDKAHKSVFPRMHSRRADHVRLYEEFMKTNGGFTKGVKPTLSQNVKFFFQVQLGQWYWRYFGWNFVGREGHIKGQDTLMPNEAGEIVPLLSQSKARNNYWGLPLILGLIGLIFHSIKNGKEASIVGLLFFFTGLAILIYLNTPPNEPRERDYAYVGSFYAFAIWIGLGCLAIWNALRTGYFLSEEATKSPIKFVKTSGSVALGIAVLASSCVPSIMALEGWDDHDRSGRYFSIDQGKNMLQSCAPNSVLFTGGDNDTFPLWYLQEVEGFRTDVRICNLSLFNTDWYINQMKLDVHSGEGEDESKGLPIKLSSKLYEEGTNDAIYYADRNGKAEDPKMNLRAFMNLVMAYNNQVVKFEDDKPQVLLPSKFLSVPFDAELMLKKENERIALGQHPMIPEEYKSQVVNEIVWKLKGGNYFEKKHFVMLDMLSNIMQNGWDRPVYFSTGISKSDYLGLDDYLILEGLSYRLTPVRHGQKTDVINEKAMEDNLFNKFVFRGLDDPTRCYTSEFPLHVSMQREHYMRYATDMANKGKYKEVIRAIDFVEEKMPDASIPYANNMAVAPQLLYVAGEKERAKIMIADFKKRFIEDAQFKKEKGLSGHGLYKDIIGLRTLLVGCDNLINLQKRKGEPVDKELEKFAADLNTDYQYAAQGFQ